MAPGRNLWIVGSTDHHLSQHFHPSAPRGAGDARATRQRAPFPRSFGTIDCAGRSADLTGTGWMFGRPAASEMASASLRSFLPRLTKGFTYRGEINRNRWPKGSSVRAQ
jgi:hypothetical protein